MQMTGRHQNTKMEASYKLKYIFTASSWNAALKYTFGAFNSQKDCYRVYYVCKPNTSLLQLGGQPSTLQCTRHNIKSSIQPVKSTTFPYRKKFNMFGPLLLVFVSFVAILHFHISMCHWDEIVVHSAPEAMVASPANPSLVRTTNRKSLDWYGYKIPPPYDWKY